MLVIIGLTAGACQTAPPEAAAPTARSIAPAALVPTMPARRAIVIATAQPSSSPAPSVTSVPAAAVSSTSQTASESAVIGLSVEGRPITARRFGDGPRAIVLAGGIHGGYESNTVALVEALIAHFAETPDAVDPAVSLYLIPALNPDGLTRSDGPAGRFNADGVDLNRNWGCDWSPTAQWRNRAVSPGATAFSEPETRAMAAFLRALRPAAAVFYHSAAGGVFAGGCADVASDSDDLAAVYGEAAGYAYGEDFSAYPVTGAAANWAAGLGIASADVELLTHADPEFERNLRAVLALQAWVASAG